MSNPNPPRNLLLPPWNEGDGPTPYVYDIAPRGHRCAWACRYLVPAGSVNLADEPGGARAVLPRWKEVGPKDWQGLEPFEMDREQILAELWDCVDRGEQEAYNAVRDIEERGVQATRLATAKLLHRLRERYPVYVLPWQKPEHEQIRGTQPTEKPYQGVNDAAIIRAAVLKVQGG